MKVKKAVPGVLRISKLSIQKANLGIRSSKNRIRKGLTTSVIGAEETEEQGQGNGGVNLNGGQNFEQLMFSKKAQDHRRIINQYQQKQECQKINETVCWHMEAGKNSGIKNAGTNPNKAAANSTWQKEQMAEQMKDSWMRTGRMVMQERAGATTVGTRVSGTTVGTATVGTKAAGTTAGAVEAAVRGATAKGTAAAGTAVGASAGAATGGTVTVAMEAAKAAKRTQQKIQETLEAAVIGKNETARRQKSEQEQPSVAKVNKGGTGKLLALVGIPALLMLIIISAILVLLIGISSIQQQPTADQIVEAARQELAASDANIGGYKYKNWYGMDADWCAMFVSWCANECGYIESGIMPKTASVASMKSWYQQQGQYHAKESGYEPKAGDVILFGNGRSHTGLVVEYDAASRIVTTIEGNTGSSGTTPYHKGSQVKEKKYPLTYLTIAGYGSPSYPGGTIEIPEPFGTEYSYMGWQVITSPSSKQYKLRQEAGMNFDENGFGKIGERFVIACTLTFGQTGDYIDWQLDNGTVIKTVVGDIKNQNDPGCNRWGHKNGLCVLEFVVDKYSWYGSDRYPTDFYAEWKGRVVRATRVGNYWN